MGVIGPGCDGLDALSWPFVKGGRVGKTEYSSSVSREGRVCRALSLDACQPLESIMVVEGTSWAIVFFCFFLWFWYVV